jgi:type I restriction enzyme, S subunit
MSLESLLGQFDTLADRSTNIAGIRKLLIINVIKRATSRKGFLDRAVEVKASLTPQTKTKAGKSTGTRNQDLALPEVLLKIPADAFARLGDVAEIEKGLTAIQKSIPGSYPLVVTAEARSTNATFDFEGPAVVIPMVSSTGHGHASLKRIHYQEGKFAAGNILSVVKPKRPDILNTRFLFEYLTAFKEELLVSRMVGTANVSLTINGLRDIPIPLIQGEDVAKVDELMALCDRLEAQLKERDIKQAALAKAALAKFTEDPTPENLQLLFHPSFSVEPEDMRKAVLTLAINGRLTRNNPGATTATASFPIVPLGSLLTDGPTNGVSPKAVSHDTGVKSLSLSATTSGVFKGEHFKFVPLKVPADSNLWLKDGDLLIQRSNSLEKVGTSAIYRGKPNQFIYPDLMMKMRLSELADVDFVQLVLCEQRVRQYFRGKAVGTSGNMPKIGQETVRNTPIPLPNLDVQRAIVEKVKRLDSMIDQLKSQLEASRTTGEKLLEAMVAELTSA